MHASSVVLVAMLTSALTAAGTVYMLQRYKVLPPQQEATAMAVVPKLEGLVEADARKNAEAVQVAFLVAGREPVEGHKDGTVIRQSVPAGQSVPLHHPVSVVLARELTKVPEVTGLAVGEATLKLKEKGYALKAGESVPNAEVEYGHIVEQSPKAGSELKPGETVTVKTSSGAAEVEVPQLAGTSHEQAKTKLEELGLVAKFAWVSLPETPSYRVVRQNPNAGQKLKPGETVSVVVNR